MKQAGQSVGIDFTGKCDVRPDTVPSHAALHYIQAEERAGRAPPGSQDRLQEELFADYFTNGVHLDAKGIGGAASRVGLDADAVSRAAADPSSHATVRQQAKAHSQRGISGVPYFFFNGQPAFSGAQDVSAFLDIFNRVPSA